MYVIFLHIDVIPVAGCKDIFKDIILTLKGYVADHSTLWRLKFFTENRNCNRTKILYWLIGNTYSLCHTPRAEMDIYITMALLVGKLTAEVQIELK